MPVGTKYSMSWHSIIVKRKREVIDLIDIRKENIATVDNLMKALEDVLRERDVNWDNIVSCLMDNCCVM